MSSHSLDTSHCVVMCSFFGSKTDANPEALQPTSKGYTLGKVASSSEASVGQAAPMPDADMSVGEAASQAADETMIPDLDATLQYVGLAGGRGSCAFTHSHLHAL